MIWNERVLVIKSEAVRRPAVGCIAWLGLSAFSFTGQELCRPARRTEQRDQAKRKCDEGFSKLIKVLGSRVVCRVRGKIVNPIDDICQRRQDEKKSEEHKGETVKIGAR